MIAHEQILLQHAILTRICRGIQFEYAIAKLAGDEATMSELQFEHARLMVNIQVLAGWLEELHIAEQKAMLVKEASRIIAHSGFFGEISND